jgi:arginyl-tRNA synthetase
VPRWAALVDRSKAENQVVYDLLGIEGLEDRGESFYEPMLADVVADLDAAGLLVVDDGARCVFVDGFTNREGEPLPLIVQKADGGYNYATTDLAAVRHRVGSGAQRILYVVDGGQGQHLQMVFAVARMAGWLPEGVEATHVGFGLVLGEDGKRLRPRRGRTSGCRTCSTRRSSVPGSSSRSGPTSAGSPSPTTPTASPRSWASAPWSTPT